MEEKLNSQDPVAQMGMTQNLDSSARYNTNENNIQFVEDGLTPEEVRFSKLLQHKFNLFRELLFKALMEPMPGLKFVGEEIKRIMGYAQETYFKHLKLYDYVLNNKQFSEVKRITF